MRTRRALKLLVVVAAMLVSLLLQDMSRAESAPTLPGYGALGQVLLDKDGCASCPATFMTTKRHRLFAFASDSPFPVSQAGRIEVTCGNGSTYHVFLQSPQKSGLFQVVPNTCVNLDSKEVKVTITSVGLSPADEDRTITLLAYASFG